MSHDDSWCKIMEDEEEENRAKNTKKSSNFDITGNKRKSTSEGTNKKQIKIRKPSVVETDLEILKRRQKQIDYGKNTMGYFNYLKRVPVDKRTKEHPKTPDKYLKYSRRSWDMLIKIWRKKLHEYDPSGNPHPDMKMNTDE